MMQSQFSAELFQRIQQCGIIAVLIVDEVEDAVPLARSLLRGGVHAMELTLRTPVAIAALNSIRAQVPDMLAGMGTILTVEQVQQVAKAGAAFAVAPGTNPRVIREAQRLHLPFAPGIVTPSDVEAALELGCRELKFFPAETSGGLTYLKSMAAPYVHLGVRFIPLGGITTNNMASYLKDPLVWAVGGSWIAPREAIQQKDWEGISARAAAAVRLAREVRPGRADS
jgi:2-dehydro-3-deoxyphosphogluconate aldolase/(4S)-4-hydroxy-2-oxoglutarate aldolase